MLQKIRVFAQSNIFLRKVIGYHLASSGLFDRFIKKYQLSAEWKKRVADVLASADNNYIPRHPDAGLIRNGTQTMHNAIKIRLGSYYGPEYSQMLMLNKGVHEPQEERVFMEAIKSLPENSLMIEMGAFWSFYSMWFQKEIKDAVNYMIEPDLFNMGHGKRNFKLNHMKGHFIQAFVSDRGNTQNEIPTICIDEFATQNNISFIHMLHSDIQGYEYNMLQGAEKCFNDKKIGYVFISTHSNEIHYKCIQFLKDKQFIILSSADLDESFSEDGLIAARASYFPGIEPVHISKRESFGIEKK